MSIQDWGAIGEMVGALAVVLTLIYLAQQIRQSSRSQRAQTHQQLADGRRDSLEMMIRYPELRHAASKARGAEALTEDENRILVWFTTIAMRGFENELYQHSMGMVEDDELEVQRQIMQLPHMQIEEVSQRRLFTPAMRKEIEDLLNRRAKVQR